jgi:hypothetical protein
MPTPAFKRIALTSRNDFGDKEAVLQNIVEIIQSSGAEVMLL